MVKSLEPTETKADGEIKKIESFLERRAKEARESLVLEYNPNIMNGSRRLEIEEVEELAPAAKAEVQSNYL